MNPPANDPITPANDASSPARVAVLLPMPFDAAFDYALPESGPALHPGDYVAVPLGRQERVGVVWDAPSTQAKPVAANKLKPVIGPVGLPPMHGAMRRFVDWLAAYTLSPPGMVLRMAMPSPSIMAPPPVKTHYIRSGDAPKRLTEARRRVLDACADGLPRTAADLAELAQVSAGVVKGLADAGTLKGVELAVDQPFDAPQPDGPAPALSDEQHKAAQQLRGDVAAGGFQPTLLEGVTGAGKTEVYFEAISEALREPAAQVLVLLPEIALTAQWLDRFAVRFGARPVEWHSDLSQAERRRAWRAVAGGQARVVVGARSALFLPFAALKLIIVDEEHDPSFKQEDGVLYNARDMAVVRASIEDIPVVLASATPAMETRVNAHQGRYRHLKLVNRHGTAELPSITAIDMRRAGPDPGHWLSPPLVTAITETLTRKEQSMLFLNRRGYAPLTLCRACGHRLECPNCSAWLVEHRYRRTLECHHCGHTLPVTRACPVCDEPDSLVACGPGVERVAEEVIALFPQARVAVVTSDTVTSPAKVAQLVATIESGAIDIIVGTQIITKGYHFPNLTLVGVVDADLGLRGGDLRAAERTYQQMVQVAGRAGREEKPGTVMLQTYEPDHPVTRALIDGDAEAFMAREQEQRDRFAMPPFGRLAGLIVTGQDLGAVQESARRIAASAPVIDGMDVFGPAPAPMARVRGWHRVRLLVKTRKETNIQKVLRHWLGSVELVRNVRLRVDIDPYSFL